MNEKLTSGLVTVAVSILGGFCLVWWLTRSPVQALEHRRPVATNQEKEASEEAVDFRGAFEDLGDLDRVAPGSWPGFRGPTGDNTLPEVPPVKTPWATTGPRRLWMADLGEGHAGPAVHKGRVYVLDHDSELPGDVLRCYSLDTGAPLWRRSYQVKVKRNHGRSRTVPAVDDTSVVTIGPRCHVLSADAVTGAFRWGIDMVREYGTAEPLWYTGQCPLLDGGVAVLAPAGPETLLLGVDAVSGAVQWRTANPHGWVMSHASVMVMTLAGRRTYVYCAVGGVAGVSAEDADRGALLWTTTLWNHAVVAPSPVVLDGNRFLVAAGYGAGSRILRVDREGDGFTVTADGTFSKRQFSCEQHTPILHDGGFITVMPADAGPLRRRVLHMGPDGTVRWKSGKNQRFGLGPYLLAGKMLFVLHDDGTLAAADVGGGAYREIARARVLSGREAWAPMALAGSRLLLRDSRQLVCLDLGGLR